MRLSESLRRGIMESAAGGIINRFKVKSRRDILFFENILAKYISNCEKAGYEKNMENIGEKWMKIFMSSSIPFGVRSIPINIVYKLAKKVWTNIGMVDDIQVEKKNDVVTIKTKNEYITRIIGKNKFSVGFFKGILEVLTNSGFICIYSNQTKEKAEYKFRANETLKKNIIEAKDKNIYNDLNTLGSIKGFTIKDALRKKLLQLKSDNRLYFREKVMSPVENTIFHLFGM
jgi:hypothetical protein